MQRNRNEDLSTPPKDVAHWVSLRGFKMSCRYDNAPTDFIPRLLLPSVCWRTDR